MTVLFTKVIIDIIGMPPWRRSDNAPIDAALWVKQCEMMAENQTCLTRRGGHSQATEG
jgi:hypothetical protein